MHGRKVSELALPSKSPLDLCAWRGVRHSVKSRTPWLKSILKSRNQKPAEIRNHLLSLNYSVKSRKLLHASLPRLISA